MCRSAGFEPEIRYEFGDVRMHAQLVAAGLAVALLPGFATAELAEQAPGRPSPIRLVPLPGEPTRNVFTSARRDMAPRPAIEAVRAALESEARQLRLPR